MALNTAGVEQAIPLIPSDYSRQSLNGGNSHIMTSTCPTTASPNSSQTSSVQDASQLCTSLQPHHCITGTFPGVASADSCIFASSHDASERSPTCGGLHDASQRSPAGNGVYTMTESGSSDVLKSWLSGDAANCTVESDRDLAERLRAAAPENYED
jgi:hypothetical protein